MPELPWLLPARILEFYLISSKARSDLCFRGSSSFDIPEGPHFHSGH